MSDPADLEKLRARLDVMTTQRDSAIRGLEEQRQQFEREMQMLLEEQDRFVSRMMDEHERDVGTLRAELDEARDTARRLNRRLDVLRREIRGHEVSAVDQRSRLDAETGHRKEAEERLRRSALDRGALEQENARLRSLLREPRRESGVMPRAQGTAQNEPQPPLRRAEGDVAAMPIVAIGPPRRGSGDSG